MYYRIKNKMDADALETLFGNSMNSAIVYDRVKEIIGRLDDTYGTLRSSRDMGGYVLLFLSEEEYELLHTQILSFYRLDVENYEYSEIINERMESSTDWWEELYLLSSDDALVIIHPKQRMKRTYSRQEDAQ